MNKSSQAIRTKIIFKNAFVMKFQINSLNIKMIIGKSILSIILIEHA